MYCRKIYSHCMLLLNLILICNRRVAHFNIKFGVFFLYWREKKAHKTVNIRSYKTSLGVFEHYIQPPTCSCLHIHILQLKSPSHLKIKTKTAGTAPVLAVPSSACTGSQFRQLKPLVQNRIGLQLNSHQMETNFRPEYKFSKTYKSQAT